MNAESIQKGQLVTHASLGLAVVKRVLKTGKRRGMVTIELREGIRAGQWYDAHPARLSPTVELE